MAEDLLKLVEREVTNNVSPDEIRSKLVQQGFLEEEVDKAIQDVTRDKGGAKESESRRLSRVFSTKEVFDRVGYGFVPHQFINILFFLTGANYFLLGVINGARTILSIVLSSMFQEYSKLRQLGKSLISWSGYLFGFSFIGMAYAALAKSPALFAFFLLLGGIGVVSHGDLYNELVRKQLKKEKMSLFLARLGHYGVLITGVSMLLSGWLLDEFPVMGSETIALMGKAYPLYGYLISFEVTAIAFILSGFMLSKVKDPEKGKKVSGFLRDYTASMKVYLGTFLHNKHLFLLILTTILFGFVQVLGNSYYGVFIYNSFKDIWLGGFLNVAVIYFIAILASFLGPWFSKKMQKATGLAPTLVFGTLLTAMMPLALAYNPNIPAIAAANALAVIGATILGVSQALLVNKLLREDERRVYFSVVSMAAVLPFIFLIPIGSYFAQAEGLVTIFKVLAGILIVLVAPLYIVLVGFGSKKRL